MKVHVVNNLDEPVADLKCQLHSFCNEYCIMIAEVAVMIANFREITAKTNERQPLVKRKEPQRGC